jgi:hypothetical protein
MRTKFQSGNLKRENLGDVEIDGRQYSTGYKQNAVLGCGLNYIASSQSPDLWKC